MTQLATFQSAECAPIQIKPAWISAKQLWSSMQRGSKSPLLVSESKSVQSVAVGLHVA